MTNAQNKLNSKVRIGAIFFDYASRPDKLIEFERKYGGEHEKNQTDLEIVERYIERAALRYIEREEMLTIAEADEYRKVLRRWYKSAEKIGAKPINFGEF